MMQSFPPTIVLRHRKENLKKCSLRGLETRPDFQFYTYPTAIMPSLQDYIILTINAPPLSQEDAHRGLFILDATWRHAEKMFQSLNGLNNIVYRSIPEHYRTAYPRRQTDCSDPERGLASIEAIYIAYQILGRDPSELLVNYHWKDLFLQKNGVYHA